MAVFAAQFERENPRARTRSSHLTSRHIGEATGAWLPGAWHRALALLDEFHGQVDPFNGNVAAEIACRPQGEDLPAGDAHVGVRAVEPIAPTAAIGIFFRALSLQDDLDGFLDLGLEFARRLGVGHAGDFAQHQGGDAVLIHFLPGRQAKESAGLLLGEDPADAFFDMGAIGPFAGDMACGQKRHDREGSGGGMAGAAELPGAVLFLHQGQERQALIDAVRKAILHGRLGKSRGREEHQ